MISAHASSPSRCPIRVELPRLSLAEPKVNSGEAAKAWRSCTQVKPKPADKMESLLTLDTLQIELGYGLVQMADNKKGGDLLERVTGVRRSFASDMGMLLPPIRLRDNLQLSTNEYRFPSEGATPSPKGQLTPGHWLAMNATNSKAILKGIPTVEPVFQLPAAWVIDAEWKNAEMLGFTVVDAPSVMVTHLSRDHSPPLSRDFDPPRCSNALG